MKLTDEEYKATLTLGVFFNKINQAALMGGNEAEHRKIVEKIISRASNDASIVDAASMFLSSMR